MRTRNLDSSGLDAIKTFSGEEKAWAALSAFPSEDVCARAGVSYDEKTGLYSLKSFGVDFLVSPETREVFSKEPRGALWLEKSDYFFRLSVVWYLASAKGIFCAGRFVNPVHIKGGQIFAKGTHTLPLGSLAEKYGSDRTGFIERGKGLGGELAPHGDVAIMLMPFPKVPVVVVLWLADEEFPARAEILLDATCDQHLPTDVIWSVAMMTVLLMRE